MTSQAASDVRPEFLGDNIDAATIAGFGKEWSSFDQSKLDGPEYQLVFDSYFEIFPFDELPASAEGFDLGCGSGRWALGVASRVGRLHCIDPAQGALAVAERRLRGVTNVDFHLASADRIPFADGSQDFGYSLGVLHHIPNTSRALADCVRKLKLGAPFLVYVYYDFENRPLWFRALWRGSDALRRMICRLPFTAKKAVTSVIAAFVYWPLARASFIVEKLSGNPSNLPLSSYRRLSFYSMRTDALDRFGTRLERRFSRGDIEKMMLQAGLTNIRFREKEPFWVACGVRGSSTARAR